MMNTKLSKCLYGFIAASVLAVSGVAQALPPEPHWLEVHAFDKQSGKPLANVAVCLGTSARTDQFGAQRTDGNGVVRFSDVRPVALVLTASGDGYQGREQLLEPLYQSRVLVVKLATGGGGPVCNAAVTDTGSEASGGLVIDSISVKRDTGSDQGVLVSARTSGAVNQIRVSEQSDFSDAAWQPYKKTVPFLLSAGSGNKVLYVQVRRASEVQGASIAVESPVKRVNYKVR